MLNKKIASEIGIGIILLVAIAMGANVWLQSKGKTDQQQISNNAEIDNQSLNSKEARTKKTAIANPAATFCIENGGRNEIRTNFDGSQTGYCVFENGNECEEWSMYEEKCDENGLVPPKDAPDRNAKPREYPEFSFNDYGYNFEVKEDK